MQRLSINEFSSYRWSFFQDVIRYSGLGFSSIGLWRSKVEEFGCEAAADLLYEMQLDVSSYSWAGGFTGSDGKSHKLAIEDSIDAIYQAHMVGADKLIIQPGSRNQHTKSHALRLLKSGIEEILPTARDLGVQILLEPVLMKQNPWTFMTTADAYNDFLMEFGSDEIGLVVDLFHIGNDPDFASRINEFSDRIKLVQLSDGRFKNGMFSRCQLGRGVLSVENWLERLSEIDYGGDYEIELHGYDFENKSYENVVRHSQDYFENAHSRLSQKQQAADSLLAGQ